MIRRGGCAPAETGVSRELIVLQRRKGTEAIFEAMQDLVTYRVNAVRKQSALRRLMGLGRGLTHDQIDENAQEEVTQQIVAWMSEEVQRLCEGEDFQERAKQITGVALRTLTLQGTTLLDGGTAHKIDAAEADIERHFAQAGRRLSNGLHMAYWKAQGERDATDVKVDVIVLSQDAEGMQALEQRAGQEFNRLYEQHKRAIAHLKESRLKHYETLRLAAAEPETIPWILPESIPFRRTPKASAFERHLYLEDDNTFRANLGAWEEGVLAEELADLSVVAWLRNIDRQPWSLEIPYREGGGVKPMFPDLVIIRQDAKGFQFDILEPHDPSLGDNAAKARGLAEFAEKHWHLFGRIQLIRKKRGHDGQEHYFRLDMSKIGVRQQVLTVSNNDQLDRIFEEEARVR